MQATRAARLAQQLQQEIAMIIHQELKDPRIGFVTITGVELSSDLSHAKVAFSYLGTDPERVLCQQALDHSTRFIQGIIKKRLRLKIIPEILFRYDDSIAQSIALSERFEQLKQDDDQ